MFPANRSSHSFARIHRIALLALLLGAVVLCTVRNCAAQEQVPSTSQTISVDQVRPGMQGYAYTIFAGDQVEKFDLEVIGVMPNFLGPKQSIILVQLKGPKVEHTGVVAGMSGSRVYLEGKLAGAPSLKLGIFTKEPIAGVTPIQDVLHPPPSAIAELPMPQFGAASETFASAGFPSGSALELIETPLV